MCLYPKTIPVLRVGSDHYEPVTVACGKCLECLQQKSNEWAHRIVDECKQHEQNCFITLTYNNEHLPLNGSLVKRDLQLFIKRLRKHLEPVKIRVFYCGEYGKKHLRPHYHIIVFGWYPDDAIFWERDKKGTLLYRSPVVERLWSIEEKKDGKKVYIPIGFSSIGNVTIDTAKYCAKYLQKLQKVPKELVQPFTGQSNRPGIGYNAIDCGSLSGDRVYHNGKSVKVPRYYLKVLERNGHDLTEFKERRQIIGAMREKCIDLQKKRDDAYNFVKKP